MESLFNNVMRLFSEARQKHPAVDGKLAFIAPRTPCKMDVDNIRWTHQPLSDHFSDGATINVLFAGRLDPLRAGVLGTDVVEIDTFVLHLQPTLDSPEVFSAELPRPTDRTRAW